MASSTRTVVDCGDGSVSEEELTAEELAAAEAAGEQAEQQRWADLRVARNALLTASDWTQLPDATANPDEWTAYRQALRDVPQNTADPYAPDWPDPPA